MVHKYIRTGIKFALFASILLVGCEGLFAQQDPPSRVARLNYLNGNVSMEPAGVDEWAPADVNRPFTIGDYLFADQGAEAELHLDDAVIRMGSQTSFGFLNLDDRTVQLKLTEGDLDVRLHNFGSDQVFEVDTPNAAVTLLRDGTYRFRIDPNGTMSFVVVREGQAQITGGGQAFLLNADNSATLNGTDQLTYDIELAPQPDEFDQWSQQRDAHEAQSHSARYLPPAVIGSEDLDDYGTWQNTSEYGQVWYPQNVERDWAPYHSGHWAWIEPWGWTWIDSKPWGFAPFHYGRWAYIGSRWGWCPGPIGVGYGGPVVRPYYAPAMVAWFGGEHFGVGVSFGGGPSLGWVPLGWGEVYTPAYHCSPRYFNNVNVYNTRVVNNVNITNVYNTVYVNKQVYNRQFVNVRAPNAVMAMPQASFASGRPVQQAATPVRQADFARLQTAAVVAPPVTPTRQSMIPTASARAAARPSTQVMQRQVVARVAPPAAPTFAARQLNSSFERPAAVARPVAANVRQAPAVANPVVVRPGERSGNAANRGTPNGPSGPAMSNRPGNPAAESHVGVSGPAEQPGAPAAAHGVPPNRQPQTTVEPNGRVAAPAPVQSNRQPEPGVAPTRQPQSTVEPNGRVAPTAPVQSNRQPEPGVAPNRQPQPEDRRPTGPTTAAPLPPQHGVPPNMRQANPAKPAENGRYTQPASAREQPQVQERTQPAPERTPVNERPAPPAREQPQVQERTQPAPERAPSANERPAPPARQQPQLQERTQPAPERAPSANERPAPPGRQQPQVQERTQPAPERQNYPSKSPEPQERSQPNHQDSRPSSHEDHPKSDKGR